MKKILILFGPPGSGKGTQAKRIASQFDYRHISTGDLLRALAKDQAALPEEKTALEAMKTGALVQDWLIFRLAFRAIEEALAQGQGVILDGAIRTPAQAEEYKKFFAEHKLEHEVLALEISLPDEESFKRLALRRVCSACGEIVPLTSLDTVPPCSKCGKALVARADDDPEVVRHRIEVQGNAVLQPLRDYYNKLGLLTIIDGRGGIAEVERMIDQVLMVH